METILPFVERSRRSLNGIPEGAWFDPYIVGFITILINRLGMDHAGPLRSQALGLMQADAWERISGIAGAVCGEEICFHSTNRSEPFERGCDDALVFIASLSDAQKAEADAAELPLGAAPASAERLAADGGRMPAELWRRCFDARIAARWHRAGAAEP